MSSSIRHKTCIYEPSTSFKSTKMENKEKTLVTSFMQKQGQRPSYARRKTYGKCHAPFFFEDPVWWLWFLVLVTKTNNFYKNISHHETQGSHLLFFTLLAMVGYYESHCIVTIKITRHTTEAKGLYFLRLNIEPKMISIIIYYL